MVKRVNWKLFEYGVEVRRSGEVDGHLVVDLGDDSQYMFEPLEAFKLGVMLGRANERLLLRDDIEWGEVDD